MAEPVTLELLGELMHRSLTDARETKATLQDITAQLRDIKDQMLVHGAILVRLESRIPLPNDAELAAIQLQSSVCSAASKRWKGEKAAR